MAAKINVGILGGGGIVGAHAPGYQKNRDRVEVVAVAEPCAEQESRLREMFGADFVMYPDYEALLKEADVDAVDICLPHDLHLPATVAAAAAGKHVLVEKVMARNVWECDRMIEACEKAGVSLHVCHDRRYYAGWMGLKQVVDSGVLGKIKFWKLDHNQNVNPSQIRQRWIGDVDRLGGGAVMSCLTHQIDALRWLGGEVQSVMCMTEVVPERMAGETCGVILARMVTGALAELSINWMTRSNTGENQLWYEMVHVCGVDGEAYYMNNRGTFVRAHSGTDVTEVLPCESPVPEDGFAKVKTGDWRGHPRCVQEWIRLLCGEEADLSSTGKDVRGTVEVAEAAYLSVERGEEIRLPIPSEPWSGFRAFPKQS